MAFAFASSVSNETSVQDDNTLWTEYLKVASEADARLVNDWTKVIDDLLVFVRFCCFCFLHNYIMVIVYRSHFLAAF